LQDSNKIRAIVGDLSYRYLDIGCISPGNLRQSTRNSLRSEQCASVRNASR